MRKLFIAIACGLLTSQTLLAELPPLPTNLVWRCNVYNTSPLGEPWLNNNGEPCVFLKIGWSVIVVSEGQSVWQHDNFEGEVTAASRCDFGFDEGPSYIFAVKNNTTTQLIEYNEASSEFIGAYNPPGLVVDGNRDSRRITTILPLHRDQPDETRTIIFANQITSYIHWGFQGTSLWTKSGQLYSYSLANNVITDSLATGDVIDYFQLSTADSSGDFLLSTDFSDYGGGQAGSILTGEQQLREITLGLEQLNSVTLNNYNIYDGPRFNPNNICFFRNRDQSLTILGQTWFGEVPYEPIYKTYLTTWPPSDLNAQYSFGRMEQIVAYQQSADGEKFALLMKPDTIALLSVDHHEIVGWFKGFIDPVKVWTLESEDGTRDRLMVLTPSSLSLYQVGALNVPTEPSAQISGFDLQIYPNPFNSSTTISYTLPRSGHYSLTVKDITGREVARLSEGWKEAGSYRSILQGGELPSGSYLFTLTADGTTKAIQVELIR